MRGLLRGFLARLLRGLDGGAAGLAGVLPEVALKEGGRVGLDVVAAPGPLRDSVEGEIALVGVQELGKLIVGHAAGFQGIGDNFSVCHGKNLL